MLNSTAKEFLFSFQTEQEEKEKEQEQEEIKTIYNEIVEFTKK